MSDHLQPEQLLALLDGDLPEAGQHLETCPVCRHQVAALRSGLDDYLAWHQKAVQLAPPPPRSWKEIGALTQGKSKPAPLRRLIWALAAAATIAIVAYPTYHHIPSVEAAELLARAETVAPPPVAPLRVHTRSREFIRPAILRDSTRAEGADIAPLFQAARFDWVQPFGAGPFADWRDHLTDKHDAVEYENGLCLIRTSSDSNSLARATLILRISDLSPVSERLEFRENETVEIWAAPEQIEAPESASPSTRSAPKAPAPSIPAPARTLHVLAALHAISADLGVLELHDEGDRLVLRASGLSTARRDEIRRAIAGIDGVDLAFEDSTASAAAPPLRRPNPKPDGPAPLRALLESKLPQGEQVEDVVNQILDSSDAIMAQAFALRTLARRYPPEQERQLAGADRDVLLRLRGDYGRELNSRAGQLAHLLSPLFDAGRVAPSATTTWQSDSEQAFTTLQSLDSLLSELLAGPPRSSPSEAEMLRQLQDAMKRAQSAVRAVE
ncbi:MAG TPA: hypothetical protein VKU19_31295 [Bryobacteraceae bacterium]|nr:hypothetical protein [Bryobacteraceae bacterium]